MGSRTANASAAPQVRGTKRQRCAPGGICQAPREHPPLAAGAMRQDSDLRCWTGCTMPATSQRCQRHDDFLARLEAAGPTALGLTTPSAYVIHTRRVILAYL